MACNNLVKKKWIGHTDKGSMSLHSASNRAPKL